MSLFDRITPRDAPAATTAANASSIFGQTAPATTTAANTSSLFGQTTVSQPQTDNASLFRSGLLGKSEAPVTATVNVTAMPPQPGYFDALLQRGKKRQTEENIGSFGELPQLQLGLQDISRKVRDLGQGGPSAGLARGADARAHYLLSASGVNAGQALRDLDELTGSTTRPQGAHGEMELTYPSGVKETLAQKYQTDFQKMVETHVQKAQDEFNKMIEERLHGVDWDAHRQRIYEHFGLKKAQNLDESAAGMNGAGSFGISSRRSRPGASTADKFGIPGMSRSVIGTPGPRGMRTSVFGDVAEKMPVDGIRPAPEDRVLRLKQEKYAERVKDLNVARMNEKVYPLLHKFSEIEAEPSNDDTSMLVNAYKALVRITGEDPAIESISDPNAVKERQNAESYLDENLNSAGSTRIRKRIINGSRRFLEQLFFTQVEASVNRSPKEANIGGIPTSIAKIKGYVRVRASKKELGPDIELLQEVNGDYCWPVLFYLLRSGLDKEALEYVEENAGAFRQIDRSFMRYLRAYVTNDDHRLPAEMQTLITNEYSQRSRLAPEDTIDPYRMVCYKIIGRCELQKRTLDAITNDMNDWLWLQFALAREYNRVDEFAHEAFGLDELRQSFKDVGERYFGPGSDVANAPTTFFFMQILAGMFEKAVADLYSHNYVSATHFAIALDFYGLLRVSDISNSDDLLSFTTRQQPQIAFGSMIGLYTRDFRTADATAAVDYLCLICLNGDLTGDLGKNQRDLCYQALTEVVLETREFARLLGDIRPDGQHMKGVIESRLKLVGLANEKDFLKHVTLVAARTAEEQSRVTDAALLFHLAEDYEKVIQVVNEAVSLALTTELGEQPARLTPLKPRATNGDPSKPQDQPNSSLSLTTVDDPIQLAQNMTELYSGNRMYYSKIKEATRESCMVLLHLASARRALEAKNWPKVIDVSHTTTKKPSLPNIVTNITCLQDVTTSGILPTEVSGNITAIRQTAQAFNQLPSVVARTVGYVMLWTVIACSNNVEKLRGAEFETGAQQETIRRCIQTSKDVMVFAGLIRFKLPGRVWEALARAGGDLGAY